MISKKKANVNHARFDGLVFQVRAKKLRSITEAFGNQPATLATILADLASGRRGGKISGAEIRRAVERKRSSLVPRGATSALKVFQDWRRDLAEAGFLKTAS